MWNGITIGYSSADETINFGTRAVAIGDSRIFETTTLATLKKSCDTKFVTKEDLKIRATCTSDLLYISSGQSFASFNTGITEILNTFGFPNQIVDAKISDDGCYLIVLLYDWSLYFCSLQKPQILFVKKVSKNPHCMSPEMEVPVGFFFSFGANNLCITVVTSSGFINKFICDNFMELLESTIDNDLKNITLNTYDLHENVKSVCGIDDGNLIAGDSICLYVEENIKSKEFLCPKHCKIKKMILTQDKNLFICLTESKTMLLVCAFTFIPLKEWNEVPISDFTVMQEMDNTSIFLLTDEEEPSLILFSMPDFSITFKLPTSPLTYLIDYPGTTDGILYLEACGDEEINTLHIKIISEGQPDLRLARMLRRGKYDEALNFAAVFNLDPEMVYKEQVKGLMKKLDVWQPENKGLQETFEEILDYLNKIKDSIFVGECALNAIVPNFTQYRKLLRYALLRVKSLPQETKNNTSTMLLDQLQSTLHKLVTFCFLNNVSDSSTTWSIEKTEQWLRFCKQDVNSICLDLIQNNLLNDALTVWNRHVAEIRNCINEHFIREYFSSLQYSVNIQDLKLWTKSFASTTLFMFYDETVTSMVSYIENKVRWNELYMYLDWINPSLEICCYFLNIINEIVSSPLCLSISRPPDSQKKLILLIKYLTELKKLNDNFGVKIALDDYELSNEDKNYSELSILILDQIQLNTFADFISTFWSTFTLERFLNSDEILSAYIKNIISQVDCWWSWEEKATLLLNFISNTQIKCYSVLSILKAASIPWSELMVQLCDKTLSSNLNAEAIKDIEEVKNLLTSRLVLKSYNLLATNITPKIIIIAVQNICAQNRSTALEDLVKLVSSQSEAVQQEAYEIYIQCLIESGLTDKAIESITNPQIIPSSMVKKICTTIWIVYDSLRNLPLFSDEASKYLIVLRFLAKSPNVDIRQECRQSANTLINIHHLKNEFKIECALSEYNYEENLLIKCVNSVLKDECFNDMQSSVIQAKLTRLSNLLFESFENVVVQFVKESALQNNDENICIFGQFISLFEKVNSQLSTKLLVLGELLVSRYDPISQAPFKVPLWTLIRRITQLVTVNCQSNLLMRAIELRQWVEPFYLTCGDVVSSDNIDLGLAYSWRNAIIDKNSIHTELFEQFKLHSLFLNLSNPGSQLYGYKKMDNNEDLFDSVAPSDKIMSSLEYFQGQNLIGLHITVTQVMCLYRYILQNHQILDPKLTSKGNNLIRSNVRQILKSVTYSRNLDMDLGLGLLNTLQPEDAMNWLEDALTNVGMNYQKLTNVTDLGLVFVRLNHKTAGGLYETLKSIKNKSIWGKKLMKYGFAFKDAFYNSDLDQRHLLQKMIRTPNMTLQILVDYCVDTNFDLQETAKLFLESCLVQWKPYTPDEKEEKTFEWLAKIIEDKELLLKKCEDIFNVISDKTDILDFLWNKVWEQVNIYYYEVFFVIMDLIDKYSMGAVIKYNVQRQILLFMVQYERVSAPEEYEKDVFNMFQESLPLPPISKYRLPYVPLASKKENFGQRKIQVWEIIKPELTFLTYSKWFSVIEAIGLDKNALCIYTIRNMVNAISIKNTNIEWYLHMRFESLLKEIQEVLSYVNDLQSVAATLYFVVNSLPLGADQLAAVKICHSQAQEWVKIENSEIAKSCIKKVVSKYVLITTKHILHTYGFGKPNYLQLALQPNELIRELYNDPIILKKNTGEIEHFPDINGAVDAIVEVHGKGGLALKVELLKEWLQPSSLGSVGSPNNSLVMSTTNTFYGNQENLTISDGVLRACYLLENDTPAYNLHNVLICHAYNEDDSDSMCPTSVRLRALQCLCLATTKNIEEITSRTKEMMKNDLIELSIITELETLGINFSPPRYRKCDKSKLVQSLLARKSLNATKLTSHLCILYSDTMNTNIWDTLLSRLIQFTLIFELEKVLIHLMDKWHQLTLDIVEKAWNVFLRSSFNSAKDSFEVIRCAKLVFSCPVIDSVDLKQIIEHCEQFQLTQYVEKLKCLS